MIKFVFNYLFEGEQEHVINSAGHLLLHHVRRSVMAICPTFGDGKSDQWITGVNLLLKGLSSNWWLVRKFIISLGVRKRHFLKSIILSELVWLLFGWSETQVIKQKQDKCLILYHFRTQNGEPNNSKCDQWDFHCSAYHWELKKVLYINYNCIS